MDALLYNKALHTQKAQDQTLVVSITTKHTFISFTTEMLQQNELKCF